MNYCHILPAINETFPRVAIQDSTDFATDAEGEDEDAYQRNR